MHLKPGKFHQKKVKIKKKYCILCLIALNESEIELHTTAVLHLNDHYIIAEMGHTKNSKNKMPGGLQ